MEGTNNPADLMTKYVPEATIKKYTAMLELEFKSGRAKGAANLHGMVPGKGRVGGDGWDARGCADHWKRHHATWRRCLFTPIVLPEDQIKLQCWTAGA